MNIDKDKIVEDEKIYTDCYGNVHDIEKDIEQAEQDIVILKQKLGMPYQTYLKSVLKQAMDADEKRLSL